jgi:site-specific DNA-methyltransferase (adenine-specific)
MNVFYQKTKDNQKNNITSVKTLKEWQEYKILNNLIDDTNKNNYIKYGTIYGKKYCIKTDYGEWDNDFSLEKLDKFIQLFYTKLKKGGSNTKLPKL